MRRRALSSAALLALAAAPLARAAVTSCTVTASGVAFGTYTPLTPSALPGTGTIGITCTVTTRSNAITVDLSAGVSNSFAIRHLTSGSYTLNYNLYLDPAYTQIWGNGTGGSLADTVTLTRTHRATSVSTTLTVYGAAGALQDPAPGTYGDNIIVTINY
jgi:spore coat protein U-like protein